MKVRLDWQVVNDDDQWETIAQEGRSDRLARLRKVPRWVWYAALVVLVTGSLAGFLGVRQHYREARRRISFQIQSVIDLEARAFARGDEDLFLAQQDPVSRRWYVQQERRVQDECERISPDLLSQEECAPVLPAKLTNVELHGDVAWVEVREGKPPVRRVRFYRQTELGWKRTAPRESFWGEEVTVRSGPFVARYRERDEPYVGPYLERIREVSEAVCGTLDCPPDGILEIEFTVSAPALDAPDLASEPGHGGSDTLSFSSPWLWGLTMEGGAPDAQLERLTQQATYTIAAQAVRASAGRDLNRLQEALLQEYAAWTSSQDPGQAPILGRIIERHGIEVLPEVLHSVGASRTLAAVMDRWLSLAVGDGQLEYFETLLNIEREALLVGRRETFMLLQHPVYSWWISDQDLLFERWREQGLAQNSPAIRVRRIERIDKRARIELHDPSRSLEGYPPALKNVIYFEYVDGDWQHASPFAAAIFWAFLSERRPAGTVTPPLTPTPAPNL